MYIKYKYIVPIAIIVTNLFMILFLTRIIDTAIFKICWYDQARDFLEQSSSMPINPGNVRISTILLLAALSISFYAKRLNKRLAVLLCVADFFIVYFITMNLNFCYTGLFLFVVINVLFLSEKMIVKLIFMSFAVFAYVYFDRGLSALDTYISFLNGDSTVVLIVFNIISTVNQVLVLLFFILAIQEEIIENKITLNKNDILEKTTKELETLNYQLIENSEKNQEISKLKERNRMAGEIHDTIGHYVTSITMGLDASLEIFDQNPEETKKLLLRLAELSRTSLLDIRMSVNELKQESLEQYSLEQIILNLIENIKGYTAVKFHTNINTGGKILNCEQKTLVMRIVQESITNCIKYSKAQNLWIHLEIIKSRLYLQIKDDGEGCKELIKGIGLQSMEDRVEKNKGNILFHTESGQGFTVRCDFDLKGE